MKIIVVCSLYLAACVVASAESLPLTLDEAITHAAQISPDIAARTAAREAAMAMIGPAGQLPDPELIVGVDNLPITGPTAGSFTRDFMTMRKIGVMQAFPRQEKRDLRAERASDAERVAYAQEQLTALDVKKQTAQAWIATYVAEELLSRLRALEASFELQSQLAKNGVQSGRVTVADALESQAALLQFKDRIYVAEQNARRARAALARWVPDDASRPLERAPDFERLPKDDLLRDIHHHASLATYDAQLDAARSEVRLAQAEKRPDWSVELAYAKRGPEFSDMFSVEFRVGLPLFAGQRQDPAIASKRAELRKVEAERETELRMHRSDVTQMVADWEILRARRDAYLSELLPLGKERVQLAIAALEAGRGDVKSALTAQQNYVELQMQALEIEGQLGRTWADLNYLTTARSGS